MIKTSDNFLTIQALRSGQRVDASELDNLLNISLAHEALFLSLLDKFVLNFSELNSKQIEHISQATLQFNNNEIFSKLLSQEQFSIACVSLLAPKYQHLWQQSGFIYQCLEHQYMNISHIPEQYLNNELLHWYVLRYENENTLPLIKPLKINESLACFFVKKHFKNFQLLSDKLKNNITVFENISPKHYVDIYIYAGPHIRANPYIAQQVVQREVNLYRHVEDVLKTPEFFLRLLRNSHELLKYAPEHIKDNEVCVWESVKKTPYTLLYASARLLNLPTFCEQLCKDMDIKTLRDTFNIWGEQIKSNIELMRTLMIKLSDAECLGYLSENIRNDKQFMKDAIMYNWKNIQYLGADLCEDGAFLLTLTEQLPQRQHNDLLGKKIYEFFSAWPDSCFDNPNFLLTLYEHYQNDFEIFIYPQIYQKNSPCIEQMNNAKQARKNGITSFFDNIRLYNNLEEKLVIHSSNKDIHKI